MNLILAILIPSIFLLSFAYAAYKKVKIYDSFTTGVKGAVPLILSIFPYITAVTMLSKLLEVSGLETRLTQWISPVFSFTGIPTEISSLVLMKPLSGSGSIAVLTQILERYGVDSYAARCACVAYGTSDTIFYIGAVYFAGIKRKKLTAALVISLVSYLIAVVFSCFLCRIM
jgi:spore maturation protein B